MKKKLRQLNRLEYKKYLDSQQETDTVLLSLLQTNFILFNCRQVWKWLFPFKIAQKTGKKLLTGDFSEFYVELQFDFDADEDELTCL